MPNLIQLYSDDNKTEKVYPITHKDGIVNDEGYNVISPIEKNNVFK